MDFSHVVCAGCDLAQGVRRTRLGRLFAENDALAHTFEVTVTRGEEKVSLEGAAVTGWFVRADGGTVAVSGTAEGSVARQRLPAACYRCEGPFSLIIKAASRTVTAALFWGEGTVTRCATDAVVDPDRVVPDLPQLLAKIAAMEAATADGRAAAGEAERAAARADEAALGAEASASAAGSAAAEAYRAAGEARGAAAQVTDALVPAFSIGTVTTLEAGEPAGASITGTAREPLLNLAIPKGRDGDGTGLTYDLPTASRSEKGGIIVGDGLAISGAVLSVPVMRAPGVDEELGATDGCRGLVPDVAYAEREKFLRGDGTWQTPEMPPVWQLRGKSAGTETAIEAGTEGTLSAAADSLEGYSPAGVVSFQLTGTGASWCTVYRVSISGGTVSVGIRNQHGTKAFSPSCSVGILYLRG